MPRLLALPLIASLAIPFLSTALADDPPAPKPRALFDGKSLEGWTATDFYKPGAVRVENGAIVLEKGNPMTGITTTRRDLPKVNYELSYEAQRKQGPDFFAAATFPVADGHLTFVNGGWHGTISGLSSINGSDASENGTSTSFQFKEGTWYRFRLQVTADRIRAYVDDKRIIDTVVSGYELRTRIESRPSQPLGFASYETTGLVRNIALRPLTASELDAMKVTDEDQ